MNPITTGKCVKLRVELYVTSAECHIGAVTWREHLICAICTLVVIGPNELSRVAGPRAVIVNLSGGAEVARSGGIAVDPESNSFAKWRLLYAVRVMTVPQEEVEIAAIRGQFDLSHPRSSTVPI